MVGWGIHSGGLYMFSGAPTARGRARVAERLYVSVVAFFDREREVAASSRAGDRHFCTYGAPFERFSGFGPFAPHFFALNLEFPPWREYGALGRASLCSILPF